MVEAYDSILNIYTHIYQLLSIVLCVVSVLEIFFVFVWVWVESFAGETRTYQGGPLW